MDKLFGIQSSHYNTEQLRGICETISDSILPQSANTSIKAFDGALLNIHSTGRFSSIFKQGDFLAGIIGYPWWKLPSKPDNEKTQAQILLESYLQYGNRFFEFINGSFALAIINTREKSTLIATDKFSCFPLSYALTSKNDFAFCSDTYALSKLAGVDDSLDPQSLFNYMYFHVVPSPNSIFVRTKKLEPAQYVQFRDGKTSHGFYWLPSYGNVTASSFNSLKQQLKDKLKTSVKECASDSATGAFLSGGTDSSTICGILSGLASEPAATYSIGFSADKYDEIEYARIASRHFKTQQHEHYVTPEEVADALPMIAQVYDEPFGNSSAIPTYFCAKLAKSNGTRLLLAGDGGDEFFGGNTRYVKQRVFEHYGNIPDFLRKLFFDPLFNNNLAYNNIFPFRKIKSYIAQASIPMPLRLESYNFLLKSDLNTVLSGDFLSAIDTNYPNELLSEIYNRTPTDDFLNKMLFLDWKQTLADNDLRKVNKMCDLAGIEVRYPFLNDELVDFSTSIPSNLKIKGKHLRYFYKKSLEDYLPMEIIKKKKHGFGLPFGEWLKVSKQLQNLVYDQLSDLKNRNLLKPEFIDQLIESHRTGHAAYYGTMVWVLAMLEIWLAKHQNSFRV